MLLILFNSYPPTDFNFQAALSVVIVYVYVESVAGGLLPFHGCWVRSTYLVLENRLSSAFEYVF